MSNFYQETARSGVVKTAAFGYNAFRENDMIFQMNHVRKSFLDENLIKDASFRIEEREKAALVGVNGAGKTTLFKIIAGELLPDEGECMFGKDARLGYLKQVIDLDSDLTVYLEAMRSKEHVMALEEEMRRIERKLTEGLEDPAPLLKRHEAVLFEFEKQNGYAVRSEITGILKGLGFPESDFDKPVSMLSGGEKTRLCLSKLLVEKPSFLLLDEPTNHLDISGIRFLENTLVSYPGAVLTISHDRYFLDRTVTKIIDLENGTTRTYGGNYTLFAEKKRIEREAAERAYEEKLKEIEHQQAVIDRLRSFNREKSIKRAESREKVLEKLGPAEKPFTAGRSMHMAFTASTLSGNDVLSVRELSKSFGERTLFRNASFEIKRGEKVCLVGDKGAKKTTLFRLLVGELSPDSGTIRFGANVEIGYFDQAHAVLHPEKTVFDELHDDHPMMDNTRIRTHLAAFLFTGDDVFKRIGELSGGEQGRVSLSKLMLNDANLLLLDEPTNHLDMAGKEVLEDALKAYDGTVIAISHDRYFINRIADRILEIHQGTLISYDGDYDYYLEKRDAFRERLVPKEVSSGAENVSREKEARLFRKEQEAKTRRREKQIRDLEARLDALSEEIDAIDLKMADPAIATDAAQLNELLSERKAKEAESESVYETWERLLEGEEKP